MYISYVVDCSSLLRVYFVDDSDGGRKRYIICFSIKSLKLSTYCCFMHSGPTCLNSTISVLHCGACIRRALIDRMISKIGVFSVQCTCMWDDLPDINFFALYCIVLFKESFASDWISFSCSQRTA